MAATLFSNTGHWVVVRMTRWQRFLRWWRSRRQPPPPPPPPVDELPDRLDDLDAAAGTRVYWRQFSTLPEGPAAPQLLDLEAIWARVKPCDNSVMEIRNGVLHCKVPNAQQEQGPCETWNRGGEGDTSKAMYSVIMAFGAGQAVTMHTRLRVPLDFNPDARVKFWDVESAGNGNRGIRWEFTGGYVGCNLDKIGQGVVRFPAQIPRDQWFTLTCVAALGGRGAGGLAVYLDGVKLGSQRLATLPDGWIYDRSQFGITASLIATEVEFQYFGLWKK